MKYKPVDQIRAPNYENGSLYNLMHSIAGALGTAEKPRYPLPQLASTELNQARTILFFLLDGVGYDFLRRQENSFLLRHCRGSIDSVFPTTTASAITTIMSGLCPQAHGIPGWFTYFKEIGGIVATLPYRLRGTREAMPAHIEGHHLFGDISFFKAGSRSLYVVTPENLADSMYSRSLCGDAQRVAYRSLDDCFEQLHALVRRDEMKYIYAYWPEFDSIAHTHGVASENAEEHFKQLDLAFESFCRRAAGSDTALIVTADHGFIDTSPEHVVRVEQHPQLAQCLTLPLCGEPRTAYCYVRPKYRQQFEDYVSDALQPFAELHESDALLDSGFFGLGARHPRFQERIGDYTLIMRGQYVIKDKLLGENDFTMIGVHGGLSEAELQVPLIFSAL